MGKVCTQTYPSFCKKSKSSPVICSTQIVVGFKSQTEYSTLRFVKNHLKAKPMQKTVNRKRRDSLFFTLWRVGEWKLGNGKMGMEKIHIFYQNNKVKLVFL